MSAQRTYTDADLTAAIALNLTARVGIIGFRSLLRRFGGGEALLRASETELTQVHGVGPLTARKIAEARAKTDGAEEVRRAEEMGAEIVPFWSERYPELLKKIYDPPLVLYVQGDPDDWQAPAVALVGSRRTSFYGRAQAERLARGLAMRGITVVSGLARGIDTAAHRGALEAGGKTLAVLGSGLASLYPPENEELARRIAQSGAVMSELPMKTQGAMWTFPRRNRIISGLALGVVVVEAGRRSGALITARCAVEHGREVFAVPGKVDNPQSGGCHALIRDGAKLVEDVADILEELGPMKQVLAEAAGKSSSADKDASPLSENERAVYDLLSGEPVSLEKIVERLGLEVRSVSSALTILEIERLVKQLPGKTFVRT